jgi:hypothetical protein
VIDLAEIGGVELVDRPPELLDPKILDVGSDDLSSLLKGDGRSGVDRGLKGRCLDGLGLPLPERRDGDGEDETLIKAFQGRSA